MNFDILLHQKGITKYKLSRMAQIPDATLSDICSGKTNILKCSVETIYRLCKALDISVEEVIEEKIVEEDRIKSFECNLPKYLKNDLDAYKEGIKNNSSLMDCLWGELYGSINIAEINDNAITQEQADYLRKKYLWR